MDLSAFSSPVNYGTSSLCRYVHATAEELKQMDAIIQKRADEVIALKRQRNTRVPISCLPHEVMADVFLWVKKTVEQVRGFSGHKNPLAWIGVSHVSYSWREIALNLAELWTAIPLWNAHWAKEMVKRSKQAPLRIKYDFREKRYCLALLKYALDRPEVLKNVSIDAIPEKQGDLIPTGLIQLERLTLSGEVGRNTHVLLPADILSKAKKLVKLELSTCRMDWISYLPSSVTVLRLDNVQTPSPIPFSRLIEALETLQSLEVLDLDNVMESFEVGDSSLHRVKLHRLRELSTISSVDKALLFFRYITFSPDIALSIETETTRSQSTFTTSIRKLFTSVGKLYENWSSDTSFETLFIHKGYALDAESLSLSLFSPSGKNHHWLASLSFNIAMDGETASDSSDILTALLDSGLPVRNVNEISLDGLEDGVDISFEGSLLAQTLDRLPRVSHIKTDDVSFDLALDIIRCPVVGSLERLCFPNLSTLELDGVEFGWETVQDGRVISMLRDCLIFRCEHNAQITKLVLVDCNYVHLDGVASLREIVADVIWDEIPDVAFPSSNSDLSEGNHWVTSDDDVELF